VVREASAVVKLSELLGLPVRTESGEELGRVHDMRAELTSNEVRVTGLVVGPLGILERLGFGDPRSRALVRSKDIVRWSAVVRADRRGVVVRDGTTLK
jgi:sporulation protein YlmC with PRC-barrel domain